MKFLTVLACTLLVLTACDRNSDTWHAISQVEPLMPTDSVVLHESDSTFVGAGSSISPGPAGTLFVSDGMNNVVHQFQRDGGYLRQFGRQGAGPGEFNGPFVAGVMHDTLLIVTDWTAGRASVFSLTTGRFVTSTKHEGYPISMAVRGDTAYIGVVNRNRNTSLAKWTLDAAEVDYFAPVPSEYAESIQLSIEVPYAVVTLLNDTILYGVAGNPGLFLARKDGVVFDTVTIPAVMRRGVPTDIVRRFTKPLDNSAIAGMLSVPVGLHRLGDGRIAVVHQDLAETKRGEQSSVSYLSIISADLQRVCPDVLFHVGQDRRPVVAFAGDTLMSFVTRLRTNDEAENVVLRYDLSKEDCPWMPVS